MKKIILNFILILIIVATTGLAFAVVLESEENTVRINYVSQETNALVTITQTPVDPEVGNGRVWITDFDDILKKNSGFAAPTGKTFIGWEYKNSVVNGSIVTSTSAYETGNHFTQDEYYSVSAGETDITLVPVYGYTVYVDGVNGIDDADGSVNNPVRTMGRAYELLAKLDSGNSDANITGFTVAGDSTTGYSYGAEDTTNLITNFNGRIVLKNSITYKDEYEGRYEYITYGDLINSSTYNASTGVAGFNDGVSTKNFTGLKTVTGYSENDPVKLVKSGNNYVVKSKTNSQTQHYMLKKVVNSYSYEVGGTIYYTYGRLTQYTENLRAHVGRGLMTPKNDGLILVTSNDGTTKYGATLEFADYTRYASGGDMIYKNLKIAFFYNSSLDKESQTYVCGYAANGNYLAMDEGITMVKDSTHIYASVYGGGHSYRYNCNNYSGSGGNNLGDAGSSTLNNTRITVKSGNWYGGYNASYGQKTGRAVATYGTTENNAGVINVYGGDFSTGIGMGHEGASSINSYVYVYGGTTATVHGSGLGSTGSMTGSGMTNVLITGESTKVNGTVYGGSTNGSHTGDVNIVIKNGTITSTIYGGNHKEKLTGNVKITIMGGSMRGIIGGCATGSITGEIVLNISGGTIVGDIYTSGQGGTQENNTQYYVGGTQDDTLNSQILNKDDDRLNVLITGDSSVDAAVIQNFAKKINSGATQYYNNKTYTVSGANYYYPQLYSADYSKLLTGYTRSTYGNHGVTQYTMNGKDAYLSLATVQGVTLNITGGEIKGDIYGGGKVAVVEGDVNINISNAKITGNIFGGGDGSVEPTVNLYVPTGRNTTATYKLTWKGSETFDITKYDQINNPPIDWDNLYVYSPNYDYMGGVNGNVTISVENGSVITGNVYGGGNEGLVTGTVTVDISDSSVSKAIYGGGNVGNISSDATIIVNAANISNLYGGGYSGKVNGSTYLDLTNANITEVFGGGYSGNVNGSTSIVINSGTFTNVFAGCDKAVVLGDTDITVGAEDSAAIVVSGVLYGGGRGVDSDNDGDASDFCTVEGMANVQIEGLNTIVENYGSTKLGKVLGNVDVTFKNYWTGNTTNKYKVMNGIDRATNVYFENAYVLLENKDEDGNLVGIKDITNLYIPEGSGIKISATGEIAGDFHGGGTFYLDSEVCLNIRGNIYGQSLVILNPLIIEEGNVIKGSESNPYMRIYGTDDSGGTALYSNDSKYNIIHGTEASGASIYYIEQDVYITENITSNIINAEGKHYTDKVSGWSLEDFYLINSGTFSTDCSVSITFLDDGTLGDLYKDVVRNLAMYSGDQIVSMPAGTNIVMVTNDEMYSYRTDTQISEISLEEFTKMEDESTNYNEITDIRANAIMVDGNELKKSYAYNENFRFVVDFSEAKEEELLKTGVYNLMVNFHDGGDVAQFSADSINVIKIEERRYYNMEHEFDREWYENDGVVTIDMTMTSEYYILFDENHKNKQLVGVVSLKNSNGEYMVLPSGMNFYLNDELCAKTNGNATYEIVDGLTQEKMVVDHTLKIDMSNVSERELLKVGDYTILVDYYIAKDGVLEENVENYELQMIIVKYDDYSMHNVVKQGNGNSGVDLLNVNRTSDNNRTIEINYFGNLVTPYVKVILQKKIGENFVDIVNSVTDLQFTIESELKEINAVFGSDLDAGAYRLNFELYDKYGELKSKQSLIFNCE